jgi:hypothetical protein
MWIIRVAHPLFTSRMIATITLNTLSVWVEYTIDRINPVMICRVSVIPSRNPMFHINEIDEGVGRSISDFFIIDMTGFFFVSWFLIRTMLILSGLGDVRVLRSSAW